MDGEDVPGNFGGAAKKTGGKAFGGGGILVGLVFKAAWPDCACTDGALPTGLLKELALGLIFPLAMLGIALTVSALEFVGIDADTTNGVRTLLFSDEPGTLVAEVTDPPA